MKYKILIVLLLISIAGGIVAWVKRGTSSQGNRPEIPAIPDGIADELARREIEAVHQQLLEKPDFVKNWAEYGYHLHALLQKNSALEVYRVCQQLQPEDPRWLYLQAVLLQKTEPRQALTLLANAERYAKNDYLSAVHMRLAECYQQLNELSKAEFHYRRAMEHDQSLDRVTYAHLGLFSLALERDDYTAAAKYLTQFENYPKLRAHATSIKLELHRLEGKVTDPKRPVAKPVAQPRPWDDPFMSPVYAKVKDQKSLSADAELFVQEGDFAGAIDILKRLVARYPTQDNYIFLGNVYFYNQNLDLAEKTLLDAKTIAKPSAAIDHLLGMISYVRGEYKWAEKSRTIERVPFEKALQYFNQAIATNPKHALAHQYLALTHYRLDNLTEALRSIEQALACDPTSPEIPIVKAYLLLANNQLTEAENWHKMSQVLLTAVSDTRVTNRYKYFNELYQMQLKEMSKQR